MPHQSTSAPRLYILLAAVTLLAAADPARAQQAETITLGWTAPTTNVDDSPVEDLAGFHLYMRADTNFVPGQNILLTFFSGVNARPRENEEYTCHITAGSIPLWFTVTAVDSAGNESAFSPPLLIGPPVAWGQKDGDEDGLPDAWEQARFGSPAITDGGKGGDFDADGVSDYEEFVAGSDPTIKGSRPRMRIRGDRAGIVIAIKAPAATGPGYEGLERRVTLERRKMEPGSKWEADPDYSDIPAYGQTLNPKATEEGGYMFRAVYWLVAE